MGNNQVSHIFCIFREIKITNNKLTTQELQELTKFLEMASRKELLPQKIMQTSEKRQLKLLRPHKVTTRSNFYSMLTLNVLLQCIFVQLSAATQ